LGEAELRASGAQMHQNLILARRTSSLLTVIGYHRLP
jgi:hypothetical protein